MYTYNYYIYMIILDMPVLVPRWWTIRIIWQPLKAVAPFFREHSLDRCIAPDADDLFVKFYALLSIYYYVDLCFGLHPSMASWHTFQMLPDGSSLLRSHLPNPYKSRNVPCQRRWGTWMTMDG